MKVAAAIADDKEDPPALIQSESAPFLRSADPELLFAELSFQPSLVS